MLGTSFLIWDQLDEFCLSDHVIRAVIDECQVDPAYVFAFLTTWAGRLLIIRRAMGKSVPFVRPETVATIPIPMLDRTSRSEIAELVISALDLYTESLAAENAAQSLLSEALD
jgi:hypothetical protein